MEQGRRLPHAPPWAPRESSAESGAMDESGSWPVASESYYGGEGGSGARRARENVVPPPLMWTAPHIAATVVIDAPNSDMVDDAALSDKSLASQSYFGDGDDQTMKPAARVDGSLPCTPLDCPRPSGLTQELALPSGSMPNPRDTGASSSLLLPLPPWPCVTPSSFPPRPPTAVGTYSSSPSLTSMGGGSGNYQNGPPVSLPYRGGGKRVANDERGMHIVPTECVVCPSPISDLTRKEIPRDVASNLLVDGLAQLFCCSTVCCKVLWGERRKVGKGLRTIVRINNWVSQQLRTTVRVGTFVWVHQDYSPHRRIDEGRGKVIKLHYDPDIECAELSVEMLGTVVKELYPMGLTPMDTLNLGEEHHEETALVRLAVAADSARKRALKSERKASIERARASSEKQSREAAEKTAAESAVVANIATSKLCHVQVESAQSVADASRQAEQADAARKASEAERDTIRSSAAATSAKHREEMKRLEQTAADSRVAADIATSKLCHMHVESAELVSDANQRAEAADAACKAADAAREAARSKTAAAMAKQRAELRALAQKLNDGKAALLRMEAESSQLALGLADTNKEEEQRRQTAEQYADDERMMREVAEASLAHLDERSLSALIAYLLPKDQRAESLLKIKSLDSLVCSDASMDEASRRCTDYKRTVSAMVDGVIEICSGSESSRAQLLQSGIVDHLNKKMKRDGCGGQVSSSSECSLFVTWSDH